MLTLTPTRKARFKAALILVGMTQGQWAEQGNRTRGYVNMVLNGKMQSRRLDEEIDAFIAEVEQSVA
jgi:hypothetical protein